MKYKGTSREIHALKRAVGEAIWDLFRGFGQEVTAASPFPLYTTKQVAKLFGVTPFTVRSWSKQGELHPRCQALSGRCYRLIFTTPDLLAFFDRNFPSEADLAHPSDPRSRKGALIEKMHRMNRLYARRRQRSQDDEEG